MSPKYFLARKPERYDANFGGKKRKMMLDPKNTVIRDAFSADRIIKISEHIRKIIGTPEFQRLRHIRQNGLASYVFPGAEHSRFTHSLGVYNTATRIFNVLRQKSDFLEIGIPNLRFDNYSERDFQAAALLHDIGHTAFSHVFERDLLPNQFSNHEECTAHLIGESENLRLAITDFADVDAVVSLIRGTHSNSVLNTLLSGPFDVDRADYIIRDSALCGVEYGKYDLIWLFHSMHIDLNHNNEPYLAFDGPRGMEALRQFLAARRHMHRHVYYHATIRAAQILLRGIFHRINEIPNFRSTVDYVPRQFLFLCENRRPTVAEFIETTDSDVHFFIKNILSKSSDAALSYLSHLFVNRKFPKVVIDSTKIPLALTKKYQISNLINRSEMIQQDLFSSDEFTIQEFVENILKFSTDKSTLHGIPIAALKHLVVHDQCRYVSNIPENYMFRFDGAYIGPRGLSEAAVGFNTKTLSDEFLIERFYGPSDIIDALRDHVRTKFLRR